MPSEQLDERQPNTSAFHNYKASSNSVVPITVRSTNANIDNITPKGSVTDNCSTIKPNNKHNTANGIVTDNLMITNDLINRNEHNIQPEGDTTIIIEPTKCKETPKTSFNLRQSPDKKASFKNNNTLNLNVNVKNTSALHISHWISFQDNISDVYHRKGRRLNGLQLPLHPLQLFGWIVLCLFCLATYYLLIPSFNEKLRAPLYGLVTGLYIVHIISHLAALLIDPADRELRRLHHSDRVVPEFDRTKHAHVIENGRCHLCNICTTSSSTKHCSVCNKCVGKFDHHCKWLNHCIGSRNYVAFLMCVVSAVCATLIILAAVLVQFALYITKPEWLNLWNDYNLAITETSIINRSFGNESLVTLYISSNKNLTKSLDTNISEFDFSNDGIPENKFLYIYSSSVIKDNANRVNAMVNDILKINNETNSTEPSNLESITFVENVSQGDNTTQNNIPNVTLSGITISRNLFLILIGCLGFLAAITAGLLLHLCFFHIYISFLGLTTYEYIRNHRHAEEANKAKQHANHIQQNGKSSTAEIFENHHPSNKTNNSAEIYFCSQVHYNNGIQLINGNDDEQLSLKRTPKTQLNVHCCANSREYNHPAFKTYYMCSTLEETAIKSSLPKSYTSNDNSKDNLTRKATISEECSNEHIKRYHCCSSFGRNRTQDHINATVSKSNSSGRKFSRKLSSISWHNDKACIASSSPQTSSINNQRCCMKSISKQQRWRRKWNCCTVVPDSPDIPNSLIASLTMKHQQELAAKQTKATEIPVHFITTTSLNGETIGNSIHTNSFAQATNQKNIKEESHLRQTCSVPGARFRHFMQMFNPYRRPQCRLQNLPKFPLTDYLKQNQIRPLPKDLDVIRNGCQHHHLNVCSSSSYCDSSSPQPPSTTTTMSEPSTDSSNLTTPTSQTCTAFKTSILPTSIIRGDTSITYVPPAGITLPPALPPPVRRKIPSPTDLDELAESLDFALHPANYNTLQSTQRFPVLNNLYRQQRRKVLRTRSPTLSPIHESGLSNPTSPQPCRHTVNSCTLTTCD